MADVTSRSHVRVTVKNRDDLTRHFSFNQLDDVEAYMAEKRKQHLKPRVEQLDESWLVRICEKGHKTLSATFKTRKDAESFIARTTEERSRGLFVDYTASLKVTLAQPLCATCSRRRPSTRATRFWRTPWGGWLADSGPAGRELLDGYREELRKRRQPSRRPGRPPECASRAHLSALCPILPTHSAHLPRISDR